jgi:hypothetical protein
MLTIPRSVPFARLLMSHSVRTLTAMLLLIAGLPATAQLVVTYGSKGVQTISYGGIVLEDISAFPSDAFHIWHMLSTDLEGNVLNTSQTTWGETNSGETWNPASSTETYTFYWGSIATQFVQSGNTLNLVVTETNNSGSGLIFDGAEIYPFLLHFPQDPAGFTGYTQVVNTTRQPGISVADFGSGVVTSVVPDESTAVYAGWKAEGSATYAPIMTTTLPDSLAAFVPVVNQPLQPGASLTYTISLRFTPEGTAATESDAWASFAAVYPFQLSWTDKRVIGTAYLASSPSGSNDTQPGGFPTNPRRYFNDPTVNITTPAGLQSFQDRILSVADSNVSDAQMLGAQGVITWDIEGEEYPQSTTYVCSPDQIATVAPEMESIVSDPSSPYVGSKLDDAYFGMLSSAGFKIGLCIRPQVFTPGPNNTASQVYLTTNSAVIANLENKATYANKRWGATIFYVDSTVDSTGDTLDPAIFEQLVTDFPNFLFIPEESTARYYAYNAPFYSFIFQGVTGTDPSVYNYYPNAFGATLINDVSASVLASNQAAITQSVAHGDILMGFAYYWQANDPTIVAIYQAAGMTSSPPTQSTPVITWPTPAPITYGTALSTAQLDASANVPGTFTYSPSAGTVLGAGSTTLLTTFMPTDAKDYKSATGSVVLSVLQATPTISWASPAPIVAGTPLSSSQLNATANTPGTFAYSPAAGTLLAAGNQTLSVLFTPTDSVDYSQQTASVSLTVTAPPSTSAPIAILSPTAGATVSGVINVLGECTLALDSAGSWLTVDGVEIGTHRVTGPPFVYPLDTTTLTDGSHVLQLWGHDISNNTTASAPVQVVVAN